LLFVCSFNLYFLGLYSASSIQGNMYTIGMLLGLSEVMGILFGDRMAEALPDHQGLIICIVFVLISGTIIKIPGLDQPMIYCLFLL